jgi:DNA-directed RNA polymerase specialized sigma24 family protein
MLKIHENNEQVIESYKEYLKTGDLTQFTSQAGIWVMRYVRQELGSTDDEASEIFFYFLEKVQKVIERYKMADPIQIIPFLSIYSRNLLKNWRRRQFSKCTNEYLKLWDYHREDSNEELSPSSVLFLRSILKKVHRINRIVLSLRYNLELSAKDRSFLLKEISKNNIEPMLFSETHHNKLFSISMKRNKILNKINYYNHKIFNLGKTYRRNNKLQKKLLVEKLKSKEELFSIKDIAQLLNISRYKVSKICKETIDVIKEEYPKFAA